MKKLFLDKFVTEKKFSSTEEYIESRVKQRVPWIAFPNLDYYLSLLKNNFLVINNVIRTSDRGFIDECYLIIDREGNLRGITEISFHQGRNGIFKPEEILTGERISDGWTIYGRTLEKNIYLMKKD
ncbi:MAG: hypothetical protein AABX99_03540 [Nanoarchaeota archaeon]